MPLSTGKTPPHISITRIIRGLEQTYVPAIHGSRQGYLWEFGSSEGQGKSYHPAKKFAFNRYTKPTPSGPWILPIINVHLSWPLRILGALVVTFRPTWLLPLFFTIFELAIEALSSYACCCLRWSRKRLIL